MLGWLDYLYANATNGAAGSIYRPAIVWSTYRQQFGPLVALPVWKAEKETAQAEGKGGHGTQGRLFD